MPSGRRGRLRSSANGVERRCCSRIPAANRLSGSSARRWKRDSSCASPSASSAALSKAHQAGLVHKDVKPANILVDCADGRTRFTGFGIASRLPRERQAPEPPEVIAGTLAYMAPEQTGRMNRSIDSRSDLYALGVTFYQMLTGAPPIQRLRPDGMGPLPYRAKA